jgi:Intra-flagellar transport protein 57
MKKTSAGKSGLKAHAMNWSDRFLLPADSKHQAEQFFNFVSLVCLVLQHALPCGPADAH